VGEELRTLKLIIGLSEEFTILWKLLMGFHLIKRRKKEIRAGLFAPVWRKSACLAASRRYESFLF